MFEVTLPKWDADALSIITALLAVLLSICIVALFQQRRKNGKHKGPTYGQLALYIFATTIYLIAEKNAIADLCA